MPSVIRIYLLLLSLAITFGSCVNLRHVGDFSETSIEGIEQYESLPQNFYRICTEDCEQKNVRNLKIHRTECNCTENQKADSITQIIYNTTRGYFYGLSDISNNELTDYQTGDITQVLATGDYGPVKLNEADVKAYSNISTAILRAFTDGYRRKKIKEYVTQAHKPLIALLHFMELNLTGNLKGKLEVQKSSLKNFYFDLVLDKKLSVYERTKFAEDYFRRISEIETKQMELDTFAEILREVAEGHKALYTNINNLSDEEVRKELAHNGSRLKNTISSLRKMN